MNKIVCVRKLRTSLHNQENQTQARRNSYPSNLMCWSLARAEIYRYTHWTPQRENEEKYK